MSNKVVLMTGIGRAAALAFAKTGSDATSFLTGQIVTVDGGKTAG